MGETILTMALISIVSAPIGAILILALGPVLLPNDSEDKEDDPENNTDREGIIENMKEFVHH